MLESLLLQRRTAILSRWFDAILDTYPPDAHRFLRKQKDRFANPVGTTLFKEMENLLQEILQGFDRERLSAILDRIIRIRTVQDFSPSAALGFLFALKEIIRSEIDPKSAGQVSTGELPDLENRIDAMALLAFDIYMQCKERVFEIRVKETQNQVSRMLRKSGMFCEPIDPGGEQNPG